jgi:hypothetical protein
MFYTSVDGHLGGRNFSCKVTHTFVNGNIVYENGSSQGLARKDQ